MATTRFWRFRASSSPDAARRSRVGASLAAGIAALCFFGIVSAGQAAILPPNFTDELVTNGVPSPTALAFTPDGRMVIADRPGRLRIYKNGALIGTAALDISGNVCGNGERGMLGVAVDPNFTPTANNYLYVYYTRKKVACGTVNGTPAPPDHPVNRLSRFTLGTNDLVDPASELPLIDEMPSVAGNHNAGDVQFGRDGYLYVSVGDGGCDYAGGGCAGTNDAARDQFILTGKVMRITRDGGIPPTNPFQGVGTERCNVTGRATLMTSKCQETYAWGLRNPFRLAFDSNAFPTRFYINDVGQAVWEEVDLGQSGADYGWNVREGHCANNSTTDCGPPSAGMTNPIYDYQHSTCETAITGGAFVPVDVWPQQYDDAYLYQDLGCGKIAMLTPNGMGGFTASDFGTGFGANTLVGMTFGPNGPGQALYYYTTNAQVRRIVFTGALPYQHPIGASPLRVSLVPAFSGCTSPNGTHGAPLRFGSCNPPARASTTARLGSKSIGFAQMAACNVGSTSSACSQSGLVKPDVRLIANLRDVRCVGAVPAGCMAGDDYNPNGAPGPYTTGCTTASNCQSGTVLASPYCAESGLSSSACIAGSDLTLTARLPGAAAGKGLRITDSYNGPTQDVAATSVASGFPIPMDCLPTAADGTVGSVCVVNTSANALVPGAIRTGDQSVWEVGEVQVLDSGMDGTRGNTDDEPLAVQGVFLP
jgi:glucose/arabinose dehydrogenase